MGKKPIVSVTYKNERISIKNSLPYLKCVLRLSSVVHGQSLYREKTVYIKTHKTAINRPVDHRRDVTHILTKVSCFVLKSFHFRHAFFVHFFAFTAQLRRQIT